MQVSIMSAVVSTDHMTEQCNAPAKPTVPYGITYTQAECTRVVEVCGV
jgi:hypothetical protein